MKSQIVHILGRAGAFAEDKDVAREIRKSEVLPRLEVGRDVTLDFMGVEAATQSFIHALISEPLRKFGEGGLEHLVFKGCGKTVKSVILTVVEYSLEETHVKE